VSQTQQVPTIDLGGGVAIPQLGFGVFQVPPQDTEEVVLRALEVGYRHIDTAAAYRNEAGVGKAVARFGLPREEVFITTKLWNADQGHDSAIQAFAGSAERLQMDYARMKENFEVFDFELTSADLDAIHDLDKGEAGRTGPDPDELALGLDG
jgi:diketogulonate reductase-like aldo/keto reductase